MAQQLGYPKEQQLGRGSHIGVVAPAPTGSILDRAEAMFGFQPGSVLNQLLEAQRETEALREEEAKIAAMLKSYRARFAYPSHFEHERKVKLSILKEARRYEFERRGTKITESALDEYAHAHADYQMFLKVGLREREEMERLEADLVNVRGKIETARAAEVYFERVTRMGEALIYHSSKEVGR